MGIKVQYNQTTFIVFKSLNFTLHVFDWKIYILIGKVKILKATAIFELVTYRFVVNALIQYCIIILM